MEISKLHAIGVRIDNDLSLYGVVSQNAEMTFNAEISLKKAKSHTEIIGLLINVINEFAHQYKHSALVGQLSTVLMHFCLKWRVEEILCSNHH